MSTWGDTLLSILSTG